MSIVITGIGIVSPIGTGRERFWEACRSGTSGARRLQGPWIEETGLSTRIAATVEDASVGADAVVHHSIARNLDRNTVFALVATHEALSDAGLTPLPDPDRRRRYRVDGVEAERLATVIGSGIGGLTSLEASHGAWRETREKQKVKRYSLPMLIPNAPAGQAAIHYGARAECKALSTACAAGTMAIGDAFHLLQRGDADVAIAGGAEAVAGDLDGYGLMGFDRLRTLSTRNDAPTRASRPFDRERDGFVLGEGAAVVILERAEYARARGRENYCKIVGYGSNCDAHSMMQLDETGRSIERLIENTLRSSDRRPEDIDYVSAHGTSTVVNDRTESRALRTVFGSRCDELPVTGLKSMTGHAIAASGPMEVAASALALQEGLLPPTINYEHPDPECPVRVVDRLTPQSIRCCVKLSYGFGGHNACLLLESG